MANSADNLHSLFNLWRSRVAQRPGATMGALMDLDGLALDEISTAFALMHVLEDQLRYLGDHNARVKVHQRNLRRWMRVPLMPQVGWSANVSSPDYVVTEETLDQIESLSSFLDGKVFDIDDERLPDLRDLVREAEALLASNSTMDPMLASYIRRLLASIRNALDDDSAGFAFDYVSAVEQLRVAFMAAAESARTPEEKTGWRNMASQIITGTGVALGIEVGKKMLGIEA
ncbi:hypothetical protein [Microbacterium sp. 22296]|uniref:hypothetical protein n=1 Tax=Microbacterium sp. 22296 TaxID=3453903 RepID=UPI003F8519CD